MLGRTLLALLPLALICAGCRSAPAAGYIRAERPAPAPLFDPATADALLEARERVKWQKPAEIIKALGIELGMTVADIGAGSGFLMPYLSQAVGSRGRVLAEEIQPEFIARLRNRASGFRNVRVVEGTATDPQLPFPADRLLMLTVYHEVQAPEAFLRALSRYTRPGGRLAIIDFDAQRQGEPPAKPGHEVAESFVLQEAESAGWRLREKHEFLSSQFFLVFETLDNTQNQDSR